MAEERPDAGYTGTDEGAPSTTSADLLRTAWSEIGTRDAPGDGDSEDLIRRARWWLEDQRPPEEADLAGADIVVSTAAREAMEEEGEFDDLSRVFEATAPRPTRTRPRPQPLPTEPPERTEGPRRAAWLVAGVIIAVALGANLLTFLVEDGGDETPAPTTSPVTTAVVPQSGVPVLSEGSLTTPWTDPCTGTEITGDLAASVTYTEDGGEAFVIVSITGELVGDDGAGYDLVIEGSTTGPPDRESYSFRAGTMELIRDDGTTFSEPTSITVDVVDGAPDNWSFEIDPFSCPS